MNIWKKNIRKKKRIRNFLKKFLELLLPLSRQFFFLFFLQLLYTMIKIDNHIVSTHKSSHLDMRCSKIFGYSSLSRSLLKLQISKISKTMNICIDNRSIIQQRSNNKFIRIERFERQLLLTETIINSFHFCCSNNPPLSRAKLILCD